MGNTPNIRFKGFTDDWEQRKLGELVEFYNGDRSSRYPNDSDMVSEGVPFINAGDLVSGRVKLDTANKITEEKFNELSGAKIQRGDIIYCLRGTLGKNAFVDNFDVGTVASSLVDIRPKKVVGKYLYQVLNSDIEYTQRIVNDEGAAQPNLSAKNLSLFNIPMPDEVEQEKIAAYFDDLDNLITLHQRKCDETKELKKFMLQKMFPKNGEKKPEIRFEGFTDDWEQRKLGEIANKVTTKNKDTQYVETFTNSAELGIISQRDFFDHDVSNMDNISGYYVVDDDAFVYNPRISTSAPVGPINRNKLGRTGVMSPLYTVFKTHSVYSEYLEWFFKSTRWHSFMKFNGDSGARSDRFSIKDAVFFEMPIPIPDIEEQKKIGQYLSTLDNLITLHQRKCDEIKEIKKFMLQNMFPQKG